MSEWHEFLTASDEDLDTVLLKWVGIGDIWFERRLVNWYSVERDIIPYCDHIELFGEEWDANYPGRNGTNYSLETDDEASLRKEVRKRVAFLIRESSPSRRAMIAKEERERRKRNRKTKPRKSVRLGSEDVWDDILPTAYVYFVQRDKKAQRYKLWAHSHGRYKLCTSNLPLNSTDVAACLLRAHGVSEEVIRDSDFPSDEAIRASTE